MPPPTRLRAPQPLSASVFSNLAPVGSIGITYSSNRAGDILAAEDWLRAQGCTHAIGPHHGSSWETHCAVLGPWKHGLFLDEPGHNAAPWLEAGYAPWKTWSSVRVPNAAMIAAHAERAHALQAAGWALLKPDELSRAQWQGPIWLRGADTLQQLTDSALADIFHYQPLAPEAFRRRCQRWTPWWSGLRVARAPDGTLAGYCFAFPDDNNREHKQWVINLVAVVPAYRGIGLGSWMVAEQHRAAEADGREACVHAMRPAGSRWERIAQGQGTLIREYALFRKAL